MHFETPPNIRPNDSAIEKEIIADSILNKEAIQKTIRADKPVDTTEEPGWNPSEEFKQEMKTEISDVDCNKEIKNYLQTLNNTELAKLENILNQIGEAPRSLTMADNGKSIVAILQETLRLYSPSIKKSTADPTREAFRYAREVLRPLL